VTWEWQYIKNKVINYCKELPKSKGFWLIVVYYLIALIAWIMIGDKI